MTTTLLQSELPTAPDPADAPKAKKKRKPRSLWPVVLLAILPIGIMAYKASGLPGAAALADALSLQSLPHAYQTRAMHLLAAPLGALIVVAARLVLGLNVLGPFRAVLLAVAFHVTGVLVGLAFFAIVIATILVWRPINKKLLPTFYGRSAAMLTCVVVITLGAMLLAKALGWHAAENVAYFPVVVLTLTGEAYAKALKREGWKSATWRVAMTALLASIITLVVSIDGVRHEFLTHPEVILFALLGIVLIARYGSFKAFEHLNPKPIKRKKRKLTGGGVGHRMNPATDLLGQPPR